MNILNNPLLLEQLAGSYALGTLRGGARRRFENLAIQHPEIASAARAWQGRLAGLHELQGAVQPRPDVWRAIENRLAAERSSTAPMPMAQTTAATAVSAAVHWWNGLNFWRGMAAAGAFATVAAVAVGVQTQSRLAGEVQSLSSKLSNSTEIAYVAVLADDQAAPSMLVTFDPKHNRLVLKRLGNFQEQPDKSLELWALPPGVAPKSLGVMESGQAVVRLAADKRGIEQTPTLAITLEAKGGVPPGAGPAGPVLFKGALIQTPPP